MPILELKNVSKSYLQAGGRLPVLRNVNLAIEEGEFVALVGFSGSGKTTLVSTLAGLVQADEGEVLFRGKPVKGASPERAVVFQSYSLMPWLSVTGNVQLAVDAVHASKGVAERRELVAKYVKMVGLSHAADRRPSELSGGMRQRVAVARALAMEPELLLLDEPLSALDAKVRDELRGEIRDLQRTLGVTTIMVTHDQDEAMEIADRIVLMNHGRIEQVGSAADLYERPAGRFVAEFVGRMNVLPLTAGMFGGIRFEADAPDAVLGIRPEHVELCDAPGADAIAGQVEKYVFLGSITRVTLAVGAGRLVLDLRGRVPGLARGAPLSVRLPREAVHRLAGGPA